MSATEYRDQDQIRWLHDVVRARGWQLDPFDAARIDADDYPRSGTHPMWFYPYSFAGDIPQQIEELSPQPLRSLFSLGVQDVIEHLVIVYAGNDQGCPLHSKTEQKLAPEMLHAQLPAALADAEQHAQTLDARALIECRFFGPCGAGWDVHGNARH